MDIACRFCGERYDHDFLHEFKTSYEATARDFKKYGCGFEEGKKCEGPMVDADAALKSQALQEMGLAPEEWAVDY